MRINTIYNCILRRISCTEKGQKLLNLFLFDYDSVVITSNLEISAEKGTLPIFRFWECRFINKGLNIKKYTNILLIESLRNPDNIINRNILKFLKDNKLYSKFDERNENFYNSIFRSVFKKFVNHWYIAKRIKDLNDSKLFDFKKYGKIMFEYVPTIKLFNILFKYYFHINKEIDINILGNISYLIFSEYDSSKNNEGILILLKNFDSKKLDNHILLYLVKMFFQTHTIEDVNLLNNLFDFLKENNYKLTISKKIIIMNMIII